MVYLNGETTYFQQCTDTSLCRNLESITMMSITSLSSVNTTCCATNNCNNVYLPPRVSSCYSFGDYTNTISGAGKISYGINGTASCVSPKNQYCVYLYGYDPISSSYLNIFTCADSCPYSSSLHSTCCTTNNCNYPSIFTLNSK